MNKSHFKFIVLQRIFQNNIIIKPNIHILKLLLKLFEAKLQKI